MTYLARIGRDATGATKEQTVEAHCRQCAEGAAAHAAEGLYHAAYLAALLHDMGKYTAEFQDYLQRAARGEPARRGSVNHTFAAVRFVMERWHTRGTPTLRGMVCEMIAVAAGAHHGLFDCIDPEGRDRLLHRVRTEGTDYAQAKALFLRRCADLDELDRLFDTAEQEILAMTQRCKPTVKSQEELQFCLALLTRMLLSVVIDADRRDAAAFMYGASLPAPPKAEDLWQGRLAAMEERLRQMPSSTPLDAVRHAISDGCRKAAGRGSGIYRLSVPTGGGKTLSSLRYALAAAAEHGKRRIFFVIPLLSVLEQNAAVIRDFIGDDGRILEHHSNVVRDSPEEQDTLDENELLMETWDAPLVITTLVQLLHTLFLGKTSSIRRMHALADSVLIIDEVQSVPRKMLSLFNMAMNFLSAAADCVIVLCSATQPYLEGVPHALHFAQPAALMPMNPAWQHVFRRTELIDRRKKSGYTTEELAEFVIDCAVQRGSLLLICNTKRQARKLYQAVRHCPGAAVYHLSTAMCMAHRIDTLAKINLCLAEGRRVICIATQLVEAGVDFSFACVIRVSAGLDNLIQAAGRCNRSGEFGACCPVYIVNLRLENLSRLKEIQDAQRAAESVLAELPQNPASEAAVQTYYRRLYTAMPEHAQDYPLPHLDSTVFSLLSDNCAFQRRSDSRGRYVMAQAFQTAGREFRVFDEETTDVLVPYKEGEGIITALGSERGKHDFLYRKALLEQARPFSVSLYQYELALLEKARGIYKLRDGLAYALQPAFYTDEIGFDAEGGSSEFLEV